MVDIATRQNKVIYDTKYCNESPDTGSNIIENVWLQQKRIYLVYRSHNPLLLSPFITCRCILYMVNTTDAIIGAGTIYPSGALKLTLSYLVSFTSCC